MSDKSLLGLAAAGGIRSGHAAMAIAIASASTGGCNDPSHKEEIPMFTKPELETIKEHALQAIEMTKIIGSMDKWQRAACEVERRKAQDIVNIIDGFNGKA
jgi:hypothetical protein